MFITKSVYNAILKRDLCVQNPSDQEHMSLNVVLKSLRVITTLIATDSCGKKEYKMLKNTVFSIEKYLRQYPSFTNMETNIENFRLFAITEQS